MNLSIPFVALMERDHNKSSPENSPSRGGGSGSGDTPPKALTGGLEDVVVTSSFTVAPTAVISPSSPHEASGKKRGRVEEHGGGSGSGSGQKGKKKGELTDLPSTDPKCATCGKSFGSWKAVFGHLRSHPERDYRGAFPPPKVWEEMLRQEAMRPLHGQDQGSSTMEMGALVGGDVEGVVATSPPSGRGIRIDLNDPEEPQQGGFPFDLNMPAPESEEDDDNES